jgi:osmotically-inducible protein OsmY
MAQDRNHRQWEDDWRGRRLQGEGEGFRPGGVGYGGDRMEAGLGDRGSNRYGGRDEWRPAARGQDEHGWPERERWRNRGQGQYLDAGLGGQRAPGDDRGFWDRASDEVQSWFGDEEAQRRRARDEEPDHRGRGPRGYVRSDERIREDVCDRLEQDRRVDASDIDVTVSGGEVRLDGYVDSRMARRRAEDCAEMISGVRYVQNNLRVHEYRGAASQTGSSAPASASASSTGRATGSPSGTSVSGPRPGSS